MFIFIVPSHCPFLTGKLVITRVLFAAFVALDKKGIDCMHYPFLPSMLRGGDSRLESGC